MNPKRAKSRTKRDSASQKLGIPIFALMVFLGTGCVVSSDTNGPDEGQGNTGADPTPEASKNEDKNNTEAIASSTTTSTELGSQLQVDIYALERLNNDLLRLRLGVTNTSSEEYRLHRGLGEEGDEYTASAISLIDATNQKRYISLDQSNGKCFCLPFEGSIASGETGDMWVIYPAPPSEVEELTIVTPLTPPMLDIPITSSTESIENSGISDPQILDLTMISDNLEDNTGRSESSDEVSIILSSDVLFETNSSELNPEAQEILEQVATEIDDASSSTVSIDGYADNTGNDSINIPLSQERAESVESALADLTTRSGIEFKVEGHGSSDPIASNETEEGRERNRRVSVTFEK